MKSNQKSGFKTRRTHDLSSGSCFPRMRLKNVYTVMRVLNLIGTHFLHPQIKSRMQTIPQPTERKRMTKRYLYLIHQSIINVNYRAKVLQVPEIRFYFRHFKPCVSTVKKKVKVVSKLLLS